MIANKKEYEYRLEFVGYTDEEKQELKEQNIKVFLTPATLAEFEAIKSSDEGFLASFFEKKVRFENLVIDDIEIKTGYDFMHNHTNFFYLNMQNEIAAYYLYKNRLGDKLKKN